MKFQIIEAKPYHCGQIMRRLRVEHGRALAKLGVNGHAELRKCFDRSYLRRAWLADEKLLALGGITGTPISSTGFIWLAFSADAERFPIAALKEGRRQINEALTNKTALWAANVTGDNAARRFLKHLGFEPEAETETGMSWRIVKHMREAA